MKIKNALSQWQDTDNLREKSKFKRKYLKQKRNVIILLVFITLSLIAVIYDSYQSLDSYTISTENIAFEKETATGIYPQGVISTYNLKQAGNKYLALNRDPQIFIAPPVHQISSTLIELNKPLSVNSYVQIYYTKNTGDFSEENSTIVFFPAGNMELIIRLPKSSYEMLRYDFNIYGEEFEIKNIYVSEKAAGKTYISKWKGLSNIFPNILITNFILFVLWVLGVKTGRIDKWIKSFINLILSIRQNPNKIKAATDAIINYRVLISLCIFLILVFFEIHGFSIDLWRKWIPDEPLKQSYTSPFLGKPRGIRTDEFAITTPVRLAQVMSNNSFPSYNRNIALSGANMLLFHAPVFSIATLAIPSHWGFFLLDKAKALAWNWWLRFFLLLLSSFEICIFLTGNEKGISVLGSFLIVFAPPVQWWYSTELVDIIYTGQLFIAGLIHYIKNMNNIKKKILFITISSLAGVGFCTNLYPPYLIPMGYLVIMFLIILFIINRKNMPLKKDDILLLSFALFASFLLLFHCFLSNLDGFKRMINTVYPGNRFFNGGDLDIKFLLTDIVCWLLPYKEEIATNNNCEYSRFITFMPLIFILGPVILFSPKNKSNDLRTIQIILFVFLLLQLARHLIVFPEIISKLTLLYMAQTGRTLIITGLTATYLGFSFFASIYKNKSCKAIRGIIPAAIITGIYCYAIIIDPNAKEYLGKFFIGTVLFYSLYNFIFVMGYKKLFYLFSLVIIFLSLPVNPIAKGTDSIYNKRITYEIQKITKAEPEEWWLSKVNWYGGNYLAAMGTKTLSATNISPDFKKYKILDPAGEHKDIYNRYSHQILYVTEEKTNFESISLDTIIIRMNKYDVLKLNIRYIFTTVYDDLSVYNDNRITFTPIAHSGIFVIYEVHRKNHAENC